MAIPLLERPAPSRDSAVCSAPRPIPGSRFAERKRARLAVLSGPDWPWARLGLLGVLVLSAALEFWHLNQLTYANSYYAAAVLSMTQSLHAFLFNSFDSAGFVTIDKPPLGFWIQVLSAKLLGFSNFSILLPEALATLASVALVYQLVKRAFGVQAGLLAALILAVVPVSVIVGRSNIIDALLVFSLLIAAWTCLRATQREAHFAGCS